MGYGYYVLADGRKAGYGVDATCDRDNCAEEIDRGLAYLCGRTPDSGYPHGCGGYFCSSHLFYGWVENTDGPPTASPHQMCEPCLDAWKAAGGPADPDDD